MREQMNPEHEHCFCLTTDGDPTCCRCGLVSDEPVRTAIHRVTRRNHIALATRLAFAADFTPLRAVESATGRHNLSGMGLG